MNDSARKELADNIRKLADALRPYGAGEIPFRHPRIHTYLLPGGTKLTFSDFSGRGRDSVYLQIDLEPAAPVAPLEHSRPPAFPGAEGFRALTPGGRGGKVYLVTTLEDYLPERRDARKEHNGCWICHGKAFRQLLGIHAEYSYLGMELLGHVIALKAGKDYKTLVIERVCRRLGMDSTRITQTPELKSRLAIGHAIPGRPVHGMDFPYLPGAGGFRGVRSQTEARLGARRNRFRA